MSAGQRAAVEGVPVEMVPTTAREHITGSAALNIPHRWRLGGDWHQSWFDVRTTRVSPDQITDERRFGRLLDRLGRTGLRDARPGLGLLHHPARDWPEKVWAATHERAVVEMAWAQLERMAGENVPVGLPPTDCHDFYRNPAPQWAGQNRPFVGTSKPASMSSWTYWPVLGAHRGPIRPRWKPGTVRALPEAAADFRVRHYRRVGDGRCYGPGNGASASPPKRTPARKRRP